MAQKLQADSTIKFFITIIGVIVIGIMLRELSSIFIPFIIAVFLYFVFKPLNTFLSKKKFPLFLITILDIVITIVIIYGFGRIVVDSLLQFSNSLPLYGEKLAAMIRATAIAWGIEDPVLTNFSFDKLMSMLDVKTLAGSVFSSTFSLLGSVLIVLFFFVFVISGEREIIQAIKNRYVFQRVKPKIKKVRKLLDKEEGKDESEAFEEELKIESAKRGKEIETTFETITDQIQKYIIAKVGVNLAAGLLTFIVLKIIGVEYPVVWGLFVFLFNFIPTLGSAIALIFPVVFTILQFESFGITILVLALMAVIQTLAFNIAEPMILGKRLNLNPLLILFSLLIWGYIWGIVGMLLSVPLTAIIKIVVSNSTSPNMEFFKHLMSQGKN